MTQARPKEERVLFLWSCFFNFNKERGEFLYQILKIFNNNVILAKGESGLECVLMGKGIGFSRSKGDLISKDGIEKVFSLSSRDMNQSWAEYLVTLSDKQYQVTKEIVSFAEKHLNCKLDDYVYLSLTDHIEFALERYQNNLIITNPLTWEIQNVHPNEYRVGLEALKIIEKYYGVYLGNEEASSIALHIINAMEEGLSFKELQDDLDVIRDIMNIIQSHFEIDFTKPSLTFERFMLHLKFFLWRIRSGTPLHEDSEDLYPIFAKKWPEVNACVEEIVEKLENSRNIEVDDHESFYLMVHINRLRLRD